MYITSASTVQVQRGAFVAHQPPIYHCLSRRKRYWIESDQQIRTILLVKNGIKGHDVSHTLSQQL